MKTPEPPKRRAKRPVSAHLAPKQTPDASNVLRLSERSEPFGVVGTATSLLVRFRDQDSAGGMQEIDLSRWLDRRPIGMAVAAFMASLGTRMKAGTREKIAGKLSVFHGFLVERELAGAARTTDLRGITTDLVNAYEVWLNGQVGRPSKMGPAEPWSGMTKAARYSALQDLFSYCSTSKALSQQMAPDTRFRRNPWPGRHHQIQGRAVLSHLDLKAIRKACIEELPGILDTLEIGAEARSIPASRLPKVGEVACRPYTDIRIRLAALHHRYDDCIPARRDLAKSDPGLAWSIAYPAASAAVTERHMHFTARTLVPIVLLLAIDGLFNAEGLLTLEWSHVDKSHPIFGPGRWRIRAEKARAGSAHHRSFASGLTAIESPVNLLRAVERFGGPARARVDQRFRDRVFVFSQGRGRPFDSFESSQGAATDAAWRRSLEKFIADNKLKPFSLSSLRVTGGDLIDAMTGGDVKAKQVALGHASTDTTDRFYQTTLGRQRGREALAVAMSWRERFLASGGRSDTRGEGLSEGRRTAATPGFGCFEPTFSPIPGQREGRACSAYGACPACPLAWIDVSDQRSRIRLTQLRDRLVEARLSVHPERWLSVWQPQLAAIDDIWMPRMPMIEGNTITLAPIPAVE